MTLPIITADQRLAEMRGVKAAIFGASGAGKTTLLRTLKASTTLFFDLEAGDLAVEGLPIDTIRPRTWTECRDFAVFIGGANPALRDDQPYSRAHFEAVCRKFGDPAALDKYDTLFVDSITVAGRLCFQWCKGQPEAHSDKTGKPDVRGAYGLHGREMIGWLTHLQHTRAKNVIFVGILDEKLDDFNRKVFVPQIEGSKTGLELPGIVDEVLTLTSLPDGELDQETVRGDRFPSERRTAAGLRLPDPEPLGLSGQGPLRPPGDARAPRSGAPDRQDPPAAAA
ncbi:AAA domain-containing protein [Ruegeria intermedia]|uniref:AAA domain-containing protein n=1 Tax=Ruegeria intermedia TaxID=996115 RepID=A0A1M5BPN3_9RHOB|nr:ATP-binding protein [Ruegeria intermedia]SHF44494.1 AAA domain-containing protein [Ruegeria intermedia]